MARRNRHDRESVWRQRAEQCKDFVCGGHKEAFRTQRQALQKADEILLHKSNREKLPERAYLCDGPHGCLLWHLTSQPLRPGQVAP